MKLKLQTRRLCLALAAAAVLAGGWLAIQAAPTSSRTRSSS